jgi:hypothetical protein
MAGRHKTPQNAHGSRAPPVANGKTRCAESRYGETFSALEVGLWRRRRRSKSLRPKWLNRAPQGASKHRLAPMGAPVEIHATNCRATARYMQSGGKAVTASPYGPASEAGCHKTLQDAVAPPGANEKTRCASTTVFYESPTRRHRMSLRACGQNRLPQDTPKHRRAALAANETERCA